MATGGGFWVAAGALRVQRSIASPSVRDNTFTFDVAHREREQSVAIFDTEDGDDVGMRKAGGHAPLAHKSLTQIRLRRILRRQHLYCAGPIELQAHNSPVWFKNVYVRELPAGAAK